ncbi:MAG: AAA family ATPase, partial [Myxococcales bacterium]|nr:AAA family ATPase [Myxococcales bacterium]
MTMDVRGFVPSRFKIVRSIGGGATGDVYEAIDRERDARVALKALRNLQAHAVTRFKREFRALQDVDHPNLVAMNELIEERGELFLTMEMVDGVDFLTWVVADPARLRPALIELCRGLGALHARGKIHRDVKPSNVLVTAEGRVVVLDFGLLADAEQGDTWTGQAIVGTPQYMAPEQAAGQPPGPAADWYAVGVMLFEVLTGRLPYEGPLMKILLDKQRDEPPDPEGLAPGAPPDLLALCRSLLRFDPDQRPTGGAILRRLGRAPTGRPVPAAATSLSMTQSAPFVGRDAELAVLADALAACSAHDRPEAVLIEGSSGVGKTTLMRAFSRGLDDGVAVLSGRCYERESVSYKAFDGVLEDVARLLSRLEPADAAAMLPLHAAQLAQVFPALKRVKAFADAPPSRGAPVDSRELRDRVFGALRELLIRLARGRRIVLALDDLQWADEDSLALLAELLRPPEAPPLLLAATMRPPADGHAAAAQRIREVCPQVRTIALGPLDDAAARELAQLLVAVHGLTGAVDLDLLSREAAGHPLLLDELVRHAADAGAAPGAALRLEDAVAARVDALEPEARRLAELVAFAGHPLYQETLARAADVAPERVGRLVSALRLANLVRTGGARAALTVEPSHDRVRAAIAARLASDTHAELHRVLAVAIEGSPQPGQEAIL